MLQARRRAVKSPGTPELCWHEMATSTAPPVSVSLAGLTLPATGGDPVRLGSLWERTPAVVVFLRHFG
jgi:hypothetical protein